MQGRTRKRNYMVRFAVAMLAYAATVVIYASALPDLSDTPWRFGLAALPVIPIALALRFYLQMLAGTDELQRRIYGEAMIVSALFTGFFTFVYAFLEQVGLPPFSTFYFFPMLIGIWGISNAILARRYR